MGTNSYPEFCHGFPCVHIYDVVLALSTLSFVCVSGPVIGFWAQLTLVFGLIGRRLQ